MAGMGEVIGLNFPAVKLVMDLYEIPNQREVFEKVVWMADFVIDKQQKNKSNT